MEEGREGGMFGEISRTGEDRLNVKGENWTYLDVWAELVAILSIERKSREPMISFGWYAE